MTLSFSLLPIIPTFYLQNWRKRSRSRFPRWNCCSLLNATLQESRTDVRQLGFHFTRLLSSSRRSSALRCLLQGTRDQSEISVRSEFVSRENTARRKKSDNHGEPRKGERRERSLIFENLTFSIFQTHLSISFVILSVLVCLCPSDL